MSSDNDRRQVVMPVWSPPLGEGPHPMERAEMMFVECAADPAELARITPSLCESADVATVMVFFANNRQPPNSLRFTECGIIQPVRWQGRPARTMPYLWVSDDMAMLGGRELFGMPKLLMDDLPLQVHANELFGRLARRSVTMLECSMVLERAAGPDELPLPELPSVYERHVPNPDPAGPSLRQLIRLSVTDRELLGTCWLGRGHLEVHHPLGSGLDRLQLQATGRAWYGAFRWNLPHGEIVAEAELPPPPANRTRR
jgi:acetoacetate decarboxylase